DNILLGFSINGVQLYHDKKLDTWIAIVIIYDYDPATWYKQKHVLLALCTSHSFRSPVGLQLVCWTSSGLPMDFCRTYHKKCISIGSPIEVQLVR
ncbi:hypothetical protein DFP72DRAFT_830648, partial [Ephemerocybe angulata]